MVANNYGIPRTYLYTVTFACRSLVTGKRHTLDFHTSPPYFGEDVYCRLCEGMTTVLIAPHEGRARCTGAPGEPCTYDTRGHWGVGNARSRAKHHALRYPTHRLRLYQGARYVGTVDALTWDDAPIRQTA